MNAFVHIGLPKTATTYLQRWLDVNRAAVRSVVNAVPTAVAHRMAVQACDPKRYHERPDVRAILERTSWERVQEVLERLKDAGPHRVVLSSEYFFLTDPARVAEVFAELGLTAAKIICVLRRQDRLVASGYAQDVKMLGRSDELRIGDYVRVYDWNILRASWQEAFPAAKFIAHDFDHLRRESSLTTVWKQDLRVAEIVTEDAVSDSDAPVNESLSAEMVEVCRLANQFGVPAVSELALRAQRSGVGGTPFRVLPETVERMKASYAPANERFMSSVSNPAEFAEYAGEGWQPDRGEDFTARLPNEIWVKLLDFAMRNPPE